MGASYPTKLKLAFRSGNRCAYPDCDLSLTVDSNDGGDPSSIGKAAHIRGENGRSARYDPSMSDEERNGFSNLIYVCPTHHDLIDSPEQNYSVEMLIEMKSDHEERVRQGVAAAFENISSEELQQAIRWVENVSPDQGVEDFDVIALEDKIRRNSLSAPSENLIRMGLGVANDVKSFVEQEAMIDSDFPLRLKGGFQTQYLELRKLNLAGDDLFEGMCEFAQRGLRKPQETSASIAVVVYLFEACEIFEK